MNLQKSILAMFAAIVGIILISSFAISYENLRAVAVCAGIPLMLAPLFPLCLDSFLGAASLFILRANLADEASHIGWIVLVLFTAISTAFNISHAPVEFIAQAAHAVPPIALCISLEMLMMIIRSEANRSPIAENRSESNKIEVKRIEVNRGSTDENRSEPQKTKTKMNGVNRIDQKRSETKQQDDDAKKRVEEYFIQHPDASINQARVDLKMAWGTVKRLRWG